MRFLKQTLAAAFLAGSTLAGSGAGADEVGFLSFEVMGQDDCNVYLMAMVDPSLDLDPALVTFAPAPGMAMPVGAKVLRTGPNMIVVPNYHVPGVYTATADGRVKTAEDECAGSN